VATARSSASRSSASRSSALGALRRVDATVRPVVLAGEQALPVAPALAPLLPAGLRRGATVAVAPGPGGTALALALVAEASARGSWVAAVGVPALGLASAGELGLSLERVLVVDPPPGAWAEVVAALLDAVDLVCTRPPARARSAAARRLAARAREQGTVIVQLAAPPGGADVTLRVAATAWTGLAGGGAGRLEARQVEVVAGGRGAAARERRTRLWLPGPDGRVAAAGATGGAPAELPWSVAG
jgi:hypothetical protein